MTSTHVKSGDTSARGRSAPRVRRGGGGGGGGPWRLIRLDAPEFDLGQTLGSGQAFHWVRSGDGWLGCIGDLPAYVEQRADGLWVNANAADAAARYFALDHAMDEIYGSFPSDPGMQAALTFSRGMRILRQPLWECLAAFITSAQKQVAHISAISRTIRQRFGDIVETPWGDVATYPDAHVVARLDEADLRACALGFRAKNLLGSARQVADGRPDLEALRSRPPEEIRVALQTLPGVGPKIADCVRLFGYGDLAAFPIDVWIERVLRAMYFPRKRRVSPVVFREFSAVYFGPYGGYAQQYLFHHARLTRGKNLIEK